MQTCRQSSFARVGSHRATCIALSEKTLRPLSASSALGESDTAAAAGVAFWASCPGRHPTTTASGTMKIERRILPSGVKLRSHQRTKVSPAQQAIATTRLVKSARGRFERLSRVARRRSALRIDPRLNVGRSIAHAAANLQEGRASALHSPLRKRVGLHAENRGHLLGVEQWSGDTLDGRRAYQCAHSTFIASFRLSALWSVLPCRLALR